MFSFLNRNAAARNLAEAVFTSIKQEAEAGMPNQVFPEKDPPGVETTWSMETIKDEWIYFHVFTFDFTTFLVFGDTPARHAVLDPFIVFVRKWLKSRWAPARPYSLLPQFGIHENLFPDGFKLNLPSVQVQGDVVTFLSEHSEPAFERLKRRMAIYAAAARSSRERRENHAVALTFTTLCRCHVLDMDYIMAVSKRFSTTKIETANLLRSIQIT